MPLDILGTQPNIYHYITEIGFESAHRRMRRTPNFRGRENFQAASFFADAKNYNQFRKGLQLPCTNSH